MSEGTAETIKDPIVADASPALSAEAEIQVPFHDLDPLGVVWHGNYYKYFEVARTELMRAIGFDVEQMKLSGYVWPVTESNCRYISPLRYGMRVLVRAGIRETEHRLKIGYQIKDKESGQLLAKGYTVQVAVKFGTWEMCFLTPAVLLENIKAAAGKTK